MKLPLKFHLEKLRGKKRKEHHPLLHKVHKEYNLSKKTLFYIKEYGPNANVPRTIIKESIKILLFASIISSAGGIALEKIKILFISFIPLIISMPVLNDMIGNYGTIVSSRFSTMIYENKVKRKWWKNLELKELYLQILIISTIIVISSSIISFFISYYLSSYMTSKMIMAKILFIELIDVLIITNLLFLVAIIAGIYFYKKKEDPNNFLIPITTSIADFGNMILLALLVKAFF